ncbi:flavin reductase [Actinomadura craniellae]|uniref:Flavin reductase n=1 Tax=Actinomadura craniellae TaxID=2231787 RepID=A0A365GYN8_9ACTN|nr:flavin reductase family protein [Actinomadura craniellae]RAY11926.1 flavin reductase [Actinomadura craniellae]
MIHVGTELTPTVLRRTFGCFPDGVAAVCGSVDGVPVGLVVSSFTSVSLDPPLSSICMSNTSKTWPRLRSAGLLGISVLSERQGTVCRQLSGDGKDRFTDVRWDTSRAGAILIENAAAWMECTVEREMAAGDHQIVLLRVHAAQANPEIAPLVFQASRLRSLGPELVDSGRRADGSARVVDLIVQVVAASGS